MAVGDVVPLRRMRFQTNERLDLVDALPLTQTPNDLLAIVMKALFGKPPAIPGAIFPDGCGWQVIKPVITGGPGPFQVSVAADTTVCIDADGQLIIKEQGVSQQINGFAVGTQYLYIYKTEVQANTETRRFMPASPPFNEFSNAMDTKFKGAHGFYVAPVGNPLVVEAAVGSTQAILCSIGRVTFDGGGTMTNFEPTANFPHNPVDPTAFAYPTNSTTPFGVLDLMLQSKAVLGLLSRLNWGGAPDSHMGGNPRSRDNDYNAWKTPGAFRPGAPQIGLEETNRRTPGTITVGDGVNTFGQLDPGDFPSTEAMFAFMFENVGVYELKAGSAFQLNGDVIPTSGGSQFHPHTTIIGNKALIVLDEHQINMTFASGSTFNDVRFQSTLGGNIYFPNDTASIANVQFNNCRFVSVNDPLVISDTVGTNPIVNAGFDGCEFQVNVDTPSDSPGVINLVNLDAFVMRRCWLYTLTSSNDVRRLVTLSKVGHDLIVENNRFEHNSDDTGVGPVITPRMLSISSTVSTVWRHRVIKNNTFCGTPKGSVATNTSRALAIELIDMTDVTVESNMLSRVRAGIANLFNTTPGSSQRLNIVVKNNTIDSAYESGISFNMVLSGTFDGITVQGNELSDVKRAGAIVMLGTVGTTLRNVNIKGNNFYNINVDTGAAYAARDGNAIRIFNMTTLAECDISGNSFLNCANSPIVVRQIFSAIEQLHIHGNTIKNTLTAEMLNNPTSTISGMVQSAYCALVDGGAGIVRGVHISDNSMQDVFSFNTTTFGTPTMVVVNGSDIVDVNIVNNTVSGIATAYSGGAMMAGYIATINSSANIQYVNVRGNSMGGLGFSTSHLTNFIATSNIVHCDISYNTIAGLFDAGLRVGFGVADAIVNMAGNAGFNISMNGNKIIMASSSTNALASHMYESNFAAVGGTNGLTIQGNQAYASHGWAIILTKGFGVHLNGRNVYNYNITGNVATRLSYSGSDLTPLFYGPFSPTIPAPAVDGNGGTTIVSHHVGYNDSGQNADGTAGTGPARNRGWSRI